MEHYHGPFQCAQQRNAWNVTFADDNQRLAFAATLLQLSTKIGANEQLTNAVAPFFRPGSKVSALVLRVCG